MDRKIVRCQNAKDSFNFNVLTSELDFKEAGVKIKIPGRDVPSQDVHVQDTHEDELSGKIINEGSSLKCNYQKSALDK